MQLYRQSLWSLYIPASILRPRVRLRIIWHMSVYHPSIQQIQVASTHRILHASHTRCPLIEMVSVEASGQTLSDPRNALDAAG